MNEEDFVEFLKDEFSFSKGLGIGDDCSVTKQGDTFQLITTDILIEDIHFDLKYFSFSEIALKSIAVNVSDIASMGGVSEYFYLSVGFPEQFLKNGLKEFFAGVKKGCKKWGVELAGGDFSKSEKLVISITMVGRSDSPVRRSGANPGDLICITGVTGESYIGLELLKRGIDIARFTKKHRNIYPETAKGLILKKYATAMIDVSDGLIKDLNRILKASEIPGCTLYYDKFPVDDEMKRICKEKNVDELTAVLSGGEDFVLLFTISKELEAELKNDSINYHTIGVLDEKKGIRVIRDGKSIDYSYMGFDHFNGSKSPYKLTFYS